MGRYGRGLLRARDTDDSTAEADSGVGERAGSGGRGGAGTGERYCGGNAGGAVWFAGTTAWARGGRGRSAAFVSSRRRDSGAAVVDWFAGCCRGSAPTGYLS